MDKSKRLTSRITVTLRVTTPTPATTLRARQVMYSLLASPPRHLNTCPRLPGEVVCSPHHRRLAPPSLLSLYLRLYLTISRFSSYKYSPHSLTPKYKPGSGSVLFLFSFLLHSNTTTVLGVRIKSVKAAYSFRFPEV